eukprot:Hpha_TRINITY_DN34729_c0_g1::TRINITY_DN34729_c0_g1_i1::g.178075::m.178075
METDEMPTPSHSFPAAGGVAVSVPPLPGASRSINHGGGLLQMVQSPPTPPPSDSPAAMSALGISASASRPLPEIPPLPTGWTMAGRVPVPVRQRSPQQTPVTSSPLAAEPSLCSNDWDPAGTTLSRASRSPSQTLQRQGSSQRPSPPPPPPTAHGTMRSYPLSEFARDRTGSGGLSERATTQAPSPRATSSPPASPPPLSVQPPSAYYTPPPTATPPTRPSPPPRATPVSPPLIVSLDPRNSQISGHESSHGATREGGLDPRRSQRSSKVSSKAPTRSHAAGKAAPRHPPATHADP